MVLSGPSGAGKSTLLKRLMKEHEGVFGFSVSRMSELLDRSHSVSALIVHWPISVNLLTLRRRHFTFTLISNTTDDLFLGFLTMLANPLLTDTTRNPRPGEEDGKGTVVLSLLVTLVSLVIVGAPHSLWRIMQEHLAWACILKTVINVCFSPLCLLFHISQPSPPTQSLTSTTLLTPK